MKILGIGACGLALSLGFALTPRGAAGQAAANRDILPETLCERLRLMPPPQLASLFDELQRTAEISDCAPADDRLIRRAGFRPMAVDADATLLLRAIPVTGMTVGRSGYAGDMNNGALWEGVGASGMVTTGVHVRLPFVSASIQPEFLFEQNADFDIRSRERVGYSEFASPYYAVIDLPQRFGSGSRARVVPGNTYLRADVGWAAAGLSTESLWRGPALRYPILMSNTAGGFPHLFLGTSRGVDVYIGRLRGEIVWGWLHESDYFDQNSANDDTRLVNVTVAFEPRFLSGLSLGATRSYHYVAQDGDGVEPVLRTLGFANTENRAGDEIASVFGRWVLRDSGAELYAEWARADVIGEWAEFLQEPDHAQAYMFGFQKVTRVSSGVSVRVHGELVHLQEKGEARTDSRPITTFYTHHQVRQGYTHEGQLLGAGVGPGADAQFIGVDALTGLGSFGAFFERVRRNDHTAPAFALRRFSPYEHDAEIIGGLRGVYFRGDLALAAELSHSLRYNREFLEDDRSWRAAVRLRWTPSLVLAR